MAEIERTRSSLPGLPTRTAGWLEEIGQLEAAARIREKGGDGGSTLAAPSTSG